MIDPTGQPVPVARTVEQELDDCRARLADLRKDYDHKDAQLAEARQQRDALVAALRDVCDAIPDATITADPPLGAWVNQARAVLAQVTP